MKLYFPSPPVPAPLRSLGRRHGYRLEHVLHLAARAAGPARVVRVGGAGVARAGPVEGPGGRGGPVTLSGHYVGHISCRLGILINESICGDFVKFSWGALQHSGDINLRQII